MLWEILGMCIVIVLTLAIWGGVYKAVHKFCDWVDRR